MYMYTELKICCFLKDITDSTIEWSLAIQLKRGAGHPVYYQDTSLKHLKAKVTLVDQLVPT